MSMYPCFHTHFLRPVCYSHQVFCFKLCEPLFKKKYIGFFYVGEFKQDETFIFSEEKSKENNMQSSIRTRLFSPRAPSLIPYKIFGVHPYLVVFLF